MIHFYLTHFGPVLYFTLETIIWFALQIMPGFYLWFFYGMLHWAEMG